MDTAPLNAVSPTSFPAHEPTSAGGWLVVPRGGPSSAALARSVGLQAKRVVDVAGAAAGLLMLAPLLVVIGLLIRTDSPGPVIFRQRRLGHHGRPFGIYKFRTMNADAESQVHRLEAHNEADRGVLFKMRDDPRVTRIGRFLRHTNLDELPQLWNVLRGEMSLVGPRPFQDRDCDRLEALDPVGFARRLELPPGLTGAWQVGRLGPTDSERLLELDLDYVERWSLGQDLKILFRTAFILLAAFRSR